MIVCDFADVYTPVGLHELVDVVASETDDAAPAALRRVHLPKLESVGLVDVDRASRTVEPAVTAEEFGRFRRAVATLADR